MNLLATEPTTAQTPSPGCLVPSPVPWRWRFALLALYAVLVVAGGVCFAHDSPYLSVLYDEYFYVEMAAEIADGLAPTMNGAGPPRYPPLYSAVLAPVCACRPYWGFLQGRGLNVLLYMTALFAVFGLARRLTGPGPALVAGAAAVLGPGLVLPEHFLSENLFIPLLLFYLLAVVRSLEAPSIARHVLAGVLAAACVWTKITALVPIGLAGAYLLLAPGPGLRERIQAFAVQAGVCALLSVPLVRHVFPEAVALTASEAQTTATSLLGPLVSSTYEHALAPLWTFGPLLAALALAGLADRVRRRPRSIEPRPEAGARAVLWLGAGIIAATFAIGAVWIALARPGEARVEERYLIPIYPLLFILAVAAVERPPRGRGWLVVFVVLAGVAACAPTYQLDPARLTKWFRQQPGAALVQLTAGEVGLGVARLGLVAIWIGLAAVFLALKNSPWRRIVYAGVLVPGLAFVWVVTGPFRDVQAVADASTRAGHVRVQRLLDRHLQPDDALMFAGEMPTTVPYAFATLHHRRYWHQHHLDPVAWLPGRFDPVTGRITRREGAAGGVLLVTRDGVTRGGVSVGADGPWRAFRLDPRTPRLHSFLIPRPDRPPGTAESVGAERIRRVFLWRLEPGTTRRLRASPEGTGVEVRLRRWAPYLDTPWFALTEAVTSDLPPIQGDEVTVTLMELGIRGGSMRITLDEDAPDRPEPDRPGKGM